MLGLGHVQVSSLQGPADVHSRRLTVLHAGVRARMPPAEQLSPHPLADQPTWQHSLKGAGQARKNESSKALLTPTEAPVRRTPRAARPQPPWKRQGHHRASLKSPRAAVSRPQTAPSWRSLGRVLTPPVHTAECLSHLLPARPCPEPASVTTSPELDGRGGWAGSIPPTRLSSRALCSPTCWRNLSQLPQEDGRVRDILQGDFFVCLLPS